jgi:hypothetical protein
MNNSSSRKFGAFGLGVSTMLGIAIFFSRHGRDHFFFPDLFSNSTHQVRAKYNHKEKHQSGKNKGTSKNRPSPDAH